MTFGEKPAINVYRYLPPDVRFAIFYACLTALTLHSKLANSLRLVRDMGLEASPNPAIQTGVSVIFLVIFSPAMIMQAAPSALAQQSYSFRGLATTRDFNTSSIVSSF